jgi:hypothetical protein
VSFSAKRTTPFHPVPTFREEPFPLTASLQLLNVQLSPKLNFGLILNPKQKLLQKNSAISQRLGGTSPQNSCSSYIKHRFIPEWSTAATFEMGQNIN